jgi:uncharacterized protein (TIGR02145 family)
MSKNLNVSKYSNGDIIQAAKTNEQWLKCGEEKIGCWCYYENKNENGSKYGKLYNWYAINDPRGLALKGWHIFTEKEWSILFEYLGGQPVVGSKLKSIKGWKGITGGKPKTSWNSSNVYPTNSSNFSALPGGYRLQNGEYQGIESHGYWWSATADDSVNAWYIFISNYSSVVLGNFTTRANGYSVRCIKDY